MTFQTRSTDLSSAKADAFNAREKALAAATAMTQAAHSAYNADIARLDAEFAADQAEAEAEIAAEAATSLDKALSKWTTAPRVSAADFAAAARKVMARCEDETGTPLSWLAVALPMARTYGYADRIVHPDARSFNGGLIAPAGAALLKDLASGAPDFAIQDSLTALEVAIARTAMRYPSCAAAAAASASVASDDAMRRMLASVGAQ